MKESGDLTNTCIVTLSRDALSFYEIKLQPAIFPLSKHVIRFHELPADDCNASYNRTFMVDWSLRGIITSKLVIRNLNRLGLRPRRF